MKKQIIRISAIMLTTSAMTLNMTCKEDNPELSISPSPPSIVFEADGKNAKMYGDIPIPQFFEVKTNQKSWEASSNQGWLKVIDDVASNSFSLEAEENTGILPSASARVTVSAGKAEPVTFIVQQKANAPSLTVMPEHRNVLFSIDGETATSNGTAFDPVFTVTTNVGSWKAESDKTWLTVEENMEDNTFTLKAEHNTRPSAPAEAKVTVSAGYAQKIEIFVNQDFDANIPSKYEEIVNPYAGVDFGSVRYLRSALHNHTNLSDAGQTPDAMRNAYYERLYDVVALTDHDWEKVTGSNITNYIYNWVSKDVPSTEFKTYNGRQTLFIQGVEISVDDFLSQDHFNVFFIDPSYRYNSHQGMKTDIGWHINNTNGIIVINHPWRCQHAEPVAYYTDMFQTYSDDRLIGIEAGGVDNQGTRSREIWDACLTNLAPERNVFGFGTDDAHVFELTPTSFFGYRWTELLVSEFTIDNVKEAMRNGQSFFVNNTTGSVNVDIYSRQFPKVTNIEVNPDNMSISVECTGETKIEWISCGKIINGATGKKTLFPDELELDKYVRFVLTGTNGTLYSQPFLLKKK